MESIVLIGMPGAGKSTIGVRIADRLNLKFVDTDKLLENEIGDSIQSFLDSHGYIELRKLEERIILRERLENRVIATGGSAVYSKNSMKYLKSQAKVIFLNVSEKELEKRINNFSSRGIARKPGQSFSSLFRERQKLYLRSCDYEINTDDISIQATLGMVEKIARS